MALPVVVGGIVIASGSTISVMNKNTNNLTLMELYAKVYHVISCSPLLKITLEQSCLHAARQLRNSYIIVPLCTHW